MKDEKQNFNRAIAALQLLSFENNKRWGQLGERFAKVKLKKEKIPSLTGTAKYRIPDILTDTELAEVKTVKYQRFTNQIRDFMQYCLDTKRQFVIYLPDDARLSQDLTKMQFAGHLEVRRLGYLSTEAAHKYFNKVFEPIIKKFIKG